MSFPTTPNRNMSAEEFLQQRVNKLNLQSDYQDDVLYVSQEGRSTLENFDLQGDPSSTNWDYAAPQSKSLDTLIVDLTPEEVRWFYKSDGEKRWIEFSGYDSLRIEWKYCELYNSLDSQSKFYPNSAFPESTSSYGSPQITSHFGSSSIKFPSKTQSNQLYGMNNRSSDSQFPHKIVVRGGLYEINFDSWKCASIYWPGEECQITRGSWFYEGTWQPLEREHSDILENKHLRMFKNHKLREYIDNEAKGTVIMTETFPEFIVEWCSPNQIYLYSENKPSKIVRSVTTRLGFHKSTGYRLFRGYKSDASIEDRPDVEITHLVFVIHGIGQKMDTGRIIRNTSSLRDCVSWFKQKYFPNFPHHRAEFFPVEWRSNLQLDGDLVNAITPNSLSSLRQMLNASAMDIMYYTSPLYGGEVQSGLREELNRLYSMFSARNPYFIKKGGKVSVVAHSLGCVILYDIIMGFEPGSLIRNTQQGLLFKVENFFCLGSPLPVFLALRYKDVLNPEILPHQLCRRLYNIFHPTDPVAYRIEPLLSREYCRFAALPIHSYNAAYHPPYSEMPLQLLESEPGKEPPNQNVVFLPSSAPREDMSPGGTPRSPTKDRSWSIWGLMKGPKRPNDSALLEMVNPILEHRMDYAIRASNLGVSYLSALTSHTAYWTNNDVAFFILTEIFPEFERSTQNNPNSYQQSYSGTSTTSDQRSYSRYDESMTGYDDKITSRGSYRSSYGPASESMHTNYPESSRFQDMSGSAQNSNGRKFSDRQPALGVENQSVPPVHSTPQNFNFPSQSGYQQPQQGVNFSQAPSNFHNQPGPSFQQTPINFQPPSNFQQQQQPAPPSSFHHQQPLQQQPPPPSSFQSGPNFQPVQQSYQNTASGYQQTVNLQQQQQQTQPQQNFPPFYQNNPNYPPQCADQGIQPSRSQNFQQSGNYPTNYSQQQPTQQQQQPMQQHPQQLNLQQQQQQQQQQQSQQQPFMQPQQIFSGFTKNIQSKTGFFDLKLSDNDKKAQNVNSPTKSTKSFFPSFNLSSLTSPVKNLSNSLSNISNQMTNMGNMGSNRDIAGNVQQSPHTSRAQGGGGGFLGGMTQNRNVPQQQQQGQHVQQSMMNQGQGLYNPVQQQQPQQQQTQQFATNKNFVQPQQQGYQSNGQQQQHQQQQQQQMAGMSVNQGQYDNMYLNQQKVLQSNMSLRGGQAGHLGFSQTNHPINYTKNMTQGNLTQMNMRGNSPVHVQQRPSTMQNYGPIETPMGAVKPKGMRMQPKIGTGFDSQRMQNKGQFESFPTNIPSPNIMTNKNPGRCVSPLGQSKVICSGGGSLGRNTSVFMSGNYEDEYGLGARSLSYGNLRNSTLVSGTGCYSGSRSGINTGFGAQNFTTNNTGLNRRTMSRPNLSTTTFSTSSGYSVHSPANPSLAMSSLVYNAPSRPYISREYNGPSTR